MEFFVIIGPVLQYSSRAQNEKKLPTYEKVNVMEVCIIYMQHCISFFKPNQ